MLCYSNRAAATRRRDCPRADAGLRWGTCDARMSSRDLAADINAVCLRTGQFTLRSGQKATEHVLRRVLTRRDLDAVQTS